MKPKFLFSAVAACILAIGILPIFQGRPPHEAKIKAKSRSISVEKNASSHYNLARMKLAEAQKRGRKLGVPGKDRREVAALLHEARLHLQLAADLEQWGENDFNEFYKEIEKLQRKRDQEYRLKKITIGSRMIKEDTPGLLKVDVQNRLPDNQ